MAVTSAAPVRMEDYAARRTGPELWRYAGEQRRKTAAYLAEGPEGWHEVSWEEEARAIGAPGATCATSPTV